MATGISRDKQIQICDARNFNRETIKKDITRFCKNEIIFNKFSQYLSVKGKTPLLILVAKVNGSIEGFAILQQRLNCKNSFDFCWIAVNPAMQRQKIGTSLCSAMLNIKKLRNKLIFVPPIPIYSLGTVAFCDTMKKNFISRIGQRFPNLLINPNSLSYSKVWNVFDLSVLSEKLKSTKRS